VRNWFKKFYKSDDFKKRIIWVNGCFDVLHRGHVEMFKYARSLGDYLVVGIDTDDRVKKAKGSNRPFNNLQDRIFMLESIKFIDKVVSFSSDKELCYWTKVYKPQIMVVGSDWRGKRVIGERNAETVLFFDRIGDYSTTKILEEK